MNISMQLRLHLIVVLSAMVAAMAAKKDDDDDSHGSSQHSGGGEGGSGGGGGSSSSNNEYIALLSLGCLAGLVAIYHLSFIVAAHIRKLASLNNEQQRSFVKQSLAWALLKEHLLYAPLLRTRHSNSDVMVSRSQSVNIGAIPGRFPALLLAGILAVNMVLLLVGIPFSDAAADPIDALVGTSGTLTIINVFPLILIAGRNNILIKMLGISFDTFNMFHRWLARIVVSLAITHALANIVPVVQQGGFTALQQAFESSMQFLTGLITVSAFIALAVHSISPLRHAFYETFLHMHILLVALALGAVWYHLAGRAQEVYVIAAIVAWVFERSLRLAILLFRNLGHGGTTAHVEALSSDALRVTLQMARPWTFRPGQHLYLYIPSVGLWTSHPFSVAWGEEILNEGKEQDMGEPQAAGRTALSLIIKRRKGFTDRLYQRAANTRYGYATLTAMVEGPYGSLHSLDSYGTVMLIAGGVGITHQVPFARHLVGGFADGMVATRRITLVWMIQTLDQLEWIRPWMKTIVDMDRCSDVLRVRIFITRANSDELRASQEGYVVQMAAGRPQMDTLVDAEISKQVGAMGVMVCGAGGLSDTVRGVCRKRQSTSNIDYIEESFTW